MFIAIGIIDTANSCFRSKDRATTGTMIHDDSGVGRHLLLFGKTALWAGNDSVQLDHFYQTIMVSEKAIDLNLFQEATRHRVPVLEPSLNPGMDRDLLL